MHLKDPHIKVADFKRALKIIYIYLTYASKRDRFWEVERIKFMSIFHLN